MHVVSPLDYWLCNHALDIRGKPAREKVWDGELQINQMGEFGERGVNHDKWAQRKTYNLGEL